MVIRFVALANGRSPSHMWSPYLNENKLRVLMDKIFLLVYKALLGVS